MHIPTLTATAITLLLALNTATQLVEAKVDSLTWDQAYSKAKGLVDKMSLEQKIAITNGAGWTKTPCVGNTNAITNPDFPSLCLQDSPLGIRFAHNVTSGVAGVNAAASFDKEAILARGVYLGKENRAKGIHVTLGPAMNFVSELKIKKLSVLVYLYHYLKKLDARS